MEADQDTNALEDLMSSGRLYKFKKGQVIPLSGADSRLMIIESGFVMRYVITNSGTPSIQSVYGPGNFFPLTLVFRLLFNQKIYSGPETIYYETLDSTDVYAMDSQTFIDKVKADPLLYPSILKEAGKRFQSNIQTIENMSLSNATRRVAHQLLYFCEGFGEKNNKTSAWEINLTITHSLLAAVLNLTRETVSQSIGELRSLKLVSAKPRSIAIPSKTKLREFAYS